MQDNGFYIIVNAVKIKAKINQSTDCISLMNLHIKF